MANTPQPGFIPRAGLGQPSPAPCDPTTNRPMRNGFTFQVRHTITGHCVFLGAFVEAQVVPLPQFAKMVCSPCSAPNKPTPPPGGFQQVFSGIGNPNFIPAASVAIYSDITVPNAPNLWLWAGGIWTEFLA